MMSYCRQCGKYTELDGGVCVECGLASVQSETHEAAWRRMLLEGSS